MSLHTARPLLVTTYYLCIVCDLCVGLSKFMYLLEIVFQKCTEIGSQLISVQMSKY